MNMVETILVFALIPVAIYAVVSLFTLRSKFAGTARYRPGQPWEYPPLWWTGNPEGIGDAHGHQVSGNGGAPRATAAGGARGSW